MDAEQKKVVLVVDDAPANIQIVQSILKDDYKLRIATGGVKALDLIRRDPKPDLVLLDVQMPEMDGYEVCAFMKASPETRDIPVIFLTGLTDIEDETKGLELGAVDYIRKPFSPAIVKARVRTHLMLRDSREELASQLHAINDEMEMARQIQLSILPQSLPAIVGVDLAARYLAMASVSGDFYDFIRVNERQLGVLVADVSGHGPPAALIASMLRIALAEQQPHAADPARVLAGINQALCGNFDRQFVTAAYVFLDMEQRLLRYAGAAHPPLVVSRKSEPGARAIEENGLPLGQFPDQTYTAVELQISQGDRCVLYTDGLPEAKNSEEQEFGTARFLQFLDRQEAAGADEFADSLIDEVFRWSGFPRGGGQRDDITLLAIAFKED
ncbi:Serine phosphatase RsbU, regulator of sigma subunit [Acidisarcina polymorpha]|uniref:Serine phosphatase RsbU, regulator of sigma subunit n=1 Tax=Acidisarcina polymorpha TaxID=2211140 RepID=A0A2Z5G784_9BACT|nr:SpoIIE family protein phosphatase [Acidisarcina polymorpha]AXC14564.1 Serine phosphatase RsbU, regulator of sigma subunit [Acidisarcina polymorpha]